MCLFVPSEPDDVDDDAGEIYGSIAYGAVGGPSAPSWTDLPPPSLLGLGKDDEASTTSPRSSPRKTPVTSPVKSGVSSPAVSPSKVREEHHEPSLMALAPTSLQSCSSVVEHPN